MDENDTKEDKKLLDIDPNKSHVFETYCLWRCLPAQLKNPPPEKNGTKKGIAEYAEEMGVEDPLILELIGIRTQAAFAERFGVAPNTLSEWNRTKRMQESLSDMRSWGRSMSKNVVMSLYRKALKYGDSFEVKLWLQVMENWEEKTRQEVEYKGVTSFTVIKNAPATDAAKQAGTGAPADAQAQP